jgi:beta-glucosidase
MAALGGNAYSFSVAWSRIFPFGMEGSPVNEKGLKYYEDLVGYSRELGIEPVM